MRRKRTAVAMAAVLAAAAIAATGQDAATTNAPATPAASTVAAPATALPALLPWRDHVKLGGDLRYRYQSTDTEGKADQPRVRQRVRARINLDAEINEQVTAGMQLATGTDKDPISQNQTLSGAADDKDVWFNRAFIDWSPREDTHVIGGKMGMPWISVNDLVHSLDYNPEGLAATYRADAGPVTLNLSGYYMVITEQSTAEDTSMQGAQGAAKLPLPLKASLTTGASLFNYSNIKDYGPFYGNGFGNTTYTVETADGETSYRYASDFNEVEGFAELALSQIPLKLSGQYVVNTESDNNDAGYVLGAAFGKCSAPGTYSLTYAYRHLEPDCVFDVFAENTDTGVGTDVESHLVSASYAPMKNTTLKVAYSMGEQGLDNGIDVTNLKVEFLVKF